MTTPKKFRQPEVKKKVFDFHRAMELFKEKRSYAVCERVVQNMDRFQRAGVLIELLLNSKYRAFNQTIFKFKSLVEDYKVGLADKAALEHYRDHLQYSTGEYLLDKLSSIRENIILDLINYNVKASISAMHWIVDTDEKFWFGDASNIDGSAEEMDKLYKSTAVDLCQIMWPDQAKGLKVLFGDKE